MLNENFTSRSQFNGAMGGDTMSRFMAADMDSAGKQRVFQAVFAAAVKKGDSPMLANLKAMHASSPYQLGLKYQGTPLPIDSERLLEDTIIQTALRERNAVNDLISRGKVRALPDIGVMTDVWKRMSNQEPASLGMSLSGGPNDDRQEFDTQGVPIPIIAKRFSFELREILAARRSGLAIETTHAARAAQMVAEKEEDMLINGSTLQVGGYQLYGYANHPQSIASTGADFGTPANIFISFNTAMDDLMDKNKFGETVFYVPVTQYSQMLADHKADSDKSALSRVLEIPGVAAVKPNKFVTTGTMIGVVMDNDDVDLAIAQNVTSVPWEVEGGAISRWRVFSSMAPRIKPDQGNQVGVVVVSGI